MEGLNKSRKPKRMQEYEKCQSIMRHEERTLHLKQDVLEEFGHLIPNLPPRVFVWMHGCGVREWTRVSPSIKDLPWPESQIFGGSWPLRLLARVSH